MDIAVVYPRFDIMGGAEKFGLEVMREWMKDHDVTLYALSVNKYLFSEFGIKVKSVTCETSVPFWRTNTLAQMAAVKSMEKQLGRHDLYFLNLFPTHLIDRHPNIWYPHEPARILYDLYPELLKRSGFSERLLMRAYFPLLRRLDKRMIHADRILSNSDYTSEYLSKVYGKPSQTVYCGVRVSEPAHRGEYVLSAGRLSYEKRVDLVIEAMEKAPDVKLKIAGTGPQEKELKRMAGDNVEFLGRVPEGQMQHLYANALCTVFTPMREPFGRVALDSIASGTPVIGGKDGGYAEVLSDGRDSFLIDPTPENIAEKINLLKRQPALRREMGENGLKKAGQYTWKKTASMLLHP